MHEIVGSPLLVWLESSDFAQAMRQWLWLYPAVEIIHITGIVLLVGSVAMFDLRLLGLSPALPVARLARHLLPWSVTGFVIVFFTGSMMFSAHASEFWDNPAFTVKMSLIALAGMNALLFHTVVYRRAGSWDTGLPAPAAAKTSAAVSLALWVGIIGCGRLLAYL